jgi:hypothetical protein
VLELHAIAAKKEEGGAEFVVAMTMQERKRFLEGIQESSALYLNMLGAVNAETSECSRPADRESIHAAIRDSIGFAKLNRMLFGVMEEWMEGQLLAELAASRKRGHLREVMGWLATLGHVYGIQGRHQDALVMEEQLCGYGQRLAALKPESQGDTTFSGSVDVYTSREMSTVGSMLNCEISDTFLQILQRILACRILLLRTLNSGGTKMLWHCSKKLFTSNNVVCLQTILQYVSRQRALFVYF